MPVKFLCCLRRVLANEGFQPRRVVSAAVGCQSRWSKKAENKDQAKLCSRVRDWTLPSGRHDRITTSPKPSATNANAQLEGSVRFADAYGACHRSHAEIGG